MHSEPYSVCGQVDSEVIRVEKALSRISDISTVRLLNNLPDHASLEEKPFVLGWLQRVVESYILSWKAPNTAEFSFLLAAIKQHGVEWFTEKYVEYSLDVPILT